MSTIQDLKKNDKFTFNDTIYIVRRKYIDEKRPLIADELLSNGVRTNEERFDYEGLEINKIKG